jgi:2-isopropylmalate synthase
MDTKTRSHGMPDAAMKYRAYPQVNIPIAHGRPRR